MKVPVLCLATTAILLLLVVLLANFKVESSPIEVHIIPHTHCDPGWLETMSGYYNSKVRTILTRVVDGLSEKPNRRFVWAET